MERRVDQKSRELATLIQLESDETFREAVAALQSETGDYDDELAEVFAQLAEKYGVTPDVMNTAIEIAKLPEEESVDQA